VRLAKYNRDLRKESGAGVGDEKPNQEHKKDERNESYERFEDALRKLARVPKEELNEKLAEHKREREKRAG
jgi:hypothetical protein